MLGKDYSPPAVTGEQRLFRFSEFTAGEFHSKYWGMEGGMWKTERQAGHVGSAEPVQIILCRLSNAASRCLTWSFAYRANPLLIGCLHNCSSAWLVFQLRAQINFKLATSGSWQTCLLATLLKPVLITVNLLICGIIALTTAPVYSRHIFYGIREQWNEQLHVIVTKLIGYFRYI